MECGKDTKLKDLDYIESNIKYTVSEKSIDGDGIVDIIITIKDKNKSNKTIGYIGTRLVWLFSDPADTFWEADGLEAWLGLDMDFLLNTDVVKKYYNNKNIRNYYYYNYLGRTYQFDLLPEYQNKGIEEYFIDNLSRIIRERKRKISMLASTFEIAGYNCDKASVQISFCRDRAFEAPITDEAFKRCSRLKETKWHKYLFWYVSYF